MSDSPRIEELRRRVQLDPASIAFAALAEEYRRAGRYEEAIATCTAGLLRHPAYLSAHVTLGRALLETGQFDEAREELEHVLRIAPENLAAIRGLAEIHHRRGELPESHEHYSTERPAESSDTAVTAAAPQPWEYGVVDAVPVPAADPGSPVEHLSASADDVPVVEDWSADADVRGPDPSPEANPALDGLESFLAAITRARASESVARD